MPAIAPAVAAAALSAAAGTTLFGLSVAGTALLVGVGNFALSTLQGKLNKPKTPNLNYDFGSRASDRTRQLRQAISTWRAVYGETRVSGPLVHAESTGGNQYLHLVIVLACHEVEAIDEIYINDESIPPDYLDGSGNVVSGKYSGYIRIKKHLGGSGQVADSDLVSESSSWSSSDKLTGKAYIYVRLKFHKDIFPTQIPNISAIVRGKKLYDPRTSTTVFSPNIALMGRDYLTDTSFGIAAAADSVNDTVLNASANSCEEIVATQNLNTDVSSVSASTDILTLTGSRLQYQRGDQVRVVTDGTLPSGISDATDYYVIPYQFKDSARIKLASSLDNAIAGTAIDITDGGTGAHTIRKVGEPRYFGGGTVDTADLLADNLKSILSGMGGNVSYIGGQWSLFAAVYQSPTYSFDEGDLRSGLKTTTKTSRASRFNTVKGVYSSPLNDWQPQDYPVVSNSTYVSNDNGEELFSDFDLSFTQRPHTAMRLAKIKLERARQEIVCQADFSIKALQVQPYNTLYFSNTTNGWSSKVFEVDSWKLVAKEDEDGKPLLETAMVLQETAAAVYDWNSGEETAVDPAPNTNLPDPFTVAVPSGFSLDSIPTSTQSGDKVFNVLAAWNLPDNQFVVSGGKSEIEYKESTEGAEAYKSGGQVNGSVTQMQLKALKPDITYDLNLYHFNSLGVRSAAASISGFMVGSTITTNTEDWENETLARDGDDWESDSLASEDWES